MKWISLSFLLLFMSTEQANCKRLISISFGPVTIGELRLPINLENFTVQTAKAHKSIKFKAHFVKDSLQWIREANNLLTPRARLAITIYTTSKDIYLQYMNNPVLLEKRNGHYYTELYVNLFSPGDVQIVANGKPGGLIKIYATPSTTKENRRLIDYSCSRYMIEFIGLENEYLSVGCHLARIGKWGSERPRLEITWSSPNIKLSDGSSAPFVSVITGTNPVVATVYDHKKKKRVIKIKALLPKRLHRFKTAYGFGPYFLDTKENDMIMESRVAPSFMLYGNFSVTDIASIRGFNATVWNGSLFNNLGIYFAYDIGEALDQRVNVVALLGGQLVTFEHKTNSKLYNQFLFPQGFEVTFHNPFGWENYLAMYGMLISLYRVPDYKNLWVRWGKKVFWELNYISWTNKNRSATMWGLSIGLPLAGFF
ncbi:MAG: hypothetical protein ISR65_13915 [Bacteriovoracaceae bacterium]|nr:hypothetical protein [Bacteriovoracaceae bacterium]